jgi:hypothetical protein
MMRHLRNLPLLALLATLSPMLHAQEEAPKPAAKKVYPPIATRVIHAGGFTLALRSDTQTLARLSPAGEQSFDFVPGGREAERAGDGYNHIGDLHLRLRIGNGAWQDFASQHQRKAIRPLPLRKGDLAAADISATLGAGLPLKVERRWVVEKGELALHFTLTNASSQPVEIGALGMPMVFDNIILDRDLDQAHSQASFVDPYIGRDAGYLQVTRLNGAGPALVVMPDKGTPLEAYKPLMQEGRHSGDDIFTEKSPRTQVSEGFYDWTVASKGFAEKEWAKAGEQWNTPTSITLNPGQSRSFGLRFAISPSIRKIEDTLAAHGRPVAVGIPGYVLPTDQTASLFLKSPSPVKSFAASPAGALTVTPDGTGKGWARYAVHAQGWGPARLSVTYADGQVQTISYDITKPLDQVAADLGHFATTRQWFEGKDDPFHRSPAILTFDREENHLLTQDSRVWVSGMSDEGGAGSWVAAMVKQLDNPNPEEVAKLERLVNETVLGHLQVAQGEHAGAVRKSLFYYDPKEFPDYYDPKIDWRSWTSWSKKDPRISGGRITIPMWR